MSLKNYIGPWSGIVYRHLPDGSPMDVLDFRYAGRDPDNRWNQGEPTLYLASSINTALLEFARHLKTNRSPTIMSHAADRRVFALEVQLREVLDLCAEGAWKCLGLDQPPYCFFDKAIARATASFARNGLRVQAIRVPSVGFLDQLGAHWCLVVFLEQVPQNPNDWIRRLPGEQLISVRDTDALRNDALGIVEAVQRADDDVPQTTEPV